MKTKTSHFIIGILLLSSFMFLSCKREKAICDDFIEITGQNHLVDIQSIAQISEINDTLTKYPQLQVYRVIDDQQLIGMHCHVFYQGLIVFSDQYSLFKSKSDNSVFSLKNEILENVDFSLTPTLSPENARNIARHTLEYSETCTYYRLGIMDINSGKGMETKDYKLVWKIQGENEFPSVILDANNGQVYRKNDGIFN